jgi:hypothetical protein
VVPLAIGLRPASWCGANFVVGGIPPGVGAAFMAFVIIYSLASGSLNGIEIAFGFGLAALAWCFRSSPGQPGRPASTPTGRPVAAPEHPG